jgi:hypothetical protein
MALRWRQIVRFFQLCRFDSVKPRSSSKRPIIALLITEYLRDDQTVSLSRLETRRIRCVTLDFRAANLACKVQNCHYHRGRLCDGLETWAKATLTFTIFHQRCVVKLAFLMEVKLPFVRSILQTCPCARISVVMLATTSSSCRTKVSLLLKHVFVSNGIQGYCFDTMSLLRLTLLRLGSVAPISVCLNA